MECKINLFGLFCKLEKLPRFFPVQLLRDEFMMRLRGLGSNKLWLRFSSQGPHR
jgi:hypothetical protein